MGAGEQEKENVYAQAHVKTSLFVFHYRSCSFSTLVMIQSH